MKKTSSFFHSLGLLVLLNVLIKPVWIFAIDRQVQNEVGTAAYGVYFSLLGLSVFFNFLLDWGLTVYFNRQLAGDPENFTGRAGSFMVIKMLFAILYTVIVLLIGFVAGIERWDILILVIMVQVLTSFFVFLRNIVTAMQWFTLDAWMSVIDKALMILLCGGFIYFPLIFGEISLIKFLYIQMACTGLAITTLLIILTRKAVSMRIRKPFPGIDVLKATLPYAMIVLLMSAHYRLDGFLLERLHPDGDYQAGVYAGAYRLLDASNMIGFLLASFLLPYTANLLGKRKSIEPVVLSSRHLLIIFSLFISITVIFHASWLQDILYHSVDPVAVTVMQVCLPVLIVYSLVHVYGTVLTARGHLLPLCYILLISVSVNIVTNLLLIPGYGARGCCISALISQGFCGIATMVYARKKSAIKLDTRSLLIYIFIGVLLATLYYLCRNVPVSPWLLISLAGLFTAALAFQFKLVDLKHWQANTIHEHEN